MGQVPWSPHLPQTHLPPCLFLYPSGNFLAITASLLTSGASWVFSASPLCCHLLNFQSLPSFTQDFGNLGYTVPLAFVLGNGSI